jgi:hypothetical protein
MARQKIMPDDGDPRHGTLNGYVNLRCRCALCRLANTEYMAKRRVERSQGPVLAEHGNPNTYSNWSCRCEPCTRAHADDVRLRSQSQRRQVRG